VTSPYLPYVRVNDQPKLASLQKLFPSAHRGRPVEFQN
jgi:hypothetical protein